MPKYIITKYALTTGVFAAEGKSCGDRGTMIEVEKAGYFHAPTGTPQSRAPLTA